jgi:hydroxyacyl-ACP dehydratase HTD2-like protein with hotdog domain
MVAYSGATWDWHRLHYDAGYVAARGLPGAVVDGQVLGALLVEQVQDWLGPLAFVHGLRFRLRAAVIAGETVRCEGAVTAVAECDGGWEVTTDQRVVVEGEPERVAVAPAGCEVLIRRDASVPPAAPLWVPA